MPIAIEAVTRIDKLFAIEREINGLPPTRRLEVHREHSRPLVESFEAWLRAERRKLSPKGPLAKAIDYTFNHWKALTRFLDDGRICLSNNAAERAVRGIAVLDFENNVYRAPHFDHSRRTRQRLGIWWR